MYNTVKLSKNNTSGTRGVYYDNTHFRWRARIIINYHQILLGAYIDKQQAINARLKAENDKEKTLKDYLQKKQHRLDNLEQELKNRIADLENQLAKLKARLKKCKLT